MLNLQVHTRNAPVRAFAIEHGCTIGKDASCDISVKGMLVGKLQARIVRENNAYYIEDQGGIAATLVNGSPITRYGPLTEADQIDIGTTTMKIVRSATAAQVAQPAQTQPASAAQQVDSPASQGTPPTAAAPAYIQMSSPPGRRPPMRGRPIRQARPRKRRRFRRSVQPGRPHRSTRHNSMFNQSHRARASPRRAKSPSKRHCACNPRTRKRRPPKTCLWRQSTAHTASNCARKRT
jgi:FOG: FHA domain